MYFCLICGIIKYERCDDMKKKSLKRHSFMQGAFIATFGIVLCKIIGMLYVIPFYAIIGDRGGALYGYAYSIYSIFLGISTISKSSINFDRFIHNSFN